jgi:hypothetical protein
LGEEGVQLTEEPAELPDDEPHQRICHSAAEPDLGEEARIGCFSVGWLAAWLQNGHAILLTKVIMIV